MLNSIVEESRLYLGKAFKLICEAVKGSLAKMGLPVNGIGGFIGIRAGILTADQWSKERKLSQINNNISALNGKIQDFRYRHANYAKLFLLEKNTLNTWQKELEEQHCLYENTGGPLLVVNAMLKTSWAVTAVFPNVPMLIKWKSFRQCK